MRLEKLLYRYDEAAALLSVSTRTILRLVDKGKIERIYIAVHEPRITSDSLESYIRGRTAQTGSLSHPP